MRRWHKGILVGLATGMIGSLLGISGLGEVFERSVGLPWLFNLRGAIEAPPEAVVVGIDTRTGLHLDLPVLPREWPRSIHGDLIEALVERGASAIVFDVDFQRERSEVHDLALAQAVARSDRVVLFQHLDGKRQPLSDLQGRHTGTIWVEELLMPYPSLAEAARGLGPFPLPKKEASVHQFWVFKSSAREAPTLPAVALQLHALQSYPDLLELLNAQQLAGVDQLPASAVDVTDAKQLRQLMLNLRELFVINPTLVEQIDQRLNDPENHATDSPASRLLTALIHLYGGDNDRYLNFYGPPGTIKTIPYHAVIKGEDPNVDPADLDMTGKVVFVGFSDLYDPGQPDRFYTVYTGEDGVDLSGVEIAATAFSNLLTNRSLRIPDTLATLGMLMVFGLTLGIIVYLLPAVVGVPIAIGLGALYATGAQLSFNLADTWLPLATPLLVQFPMALFIGLLAQYLLERHKVQHISEAISQYVPENVSRELASMSPDPSQLNKVTYSTCLATDMAGFSTIAETLKPGELAAFLNDYFDSLAQPLRNHHVDVTEFRADAIMCAWTGDTTDVNVRRNPILASLEASDAIERFKQRHAMFGASLRIGMEAGEVYVGHAGGGGHFVYSIVGDCANTASRIEGLNKHIKTQILATQAIVEGIDDLLLRDLGGFRFVGKSEPLPIVEIMAAEDKATDEQKALCERFSEGMAIYRQADWHRAAEAFEAILGDYPEDGPAAFYLEQCRERINNPPPPDDPCTINMTKK